LPSRRFLSPLDALEIHEQKNNNSKCRAEHDNESGSTSSENSSEELYLSSR
jgi:hypothetical protein